MPTSSKPRLSELQRWMRWVLTYPGGVGAAVRQNPPAQPRHWTRGDRPKPWVEMIGETEDVPRVERLAIYGGGYFGRLIECLGAIYEGVQNVVGEDDFYDLAKAYLVRYPSRARCIDNVGDKFVPFVRAHKLKRAFPFLGDLAELEHAFHLSFYADDLPPPILDGLRSMAPARFMTARLEFDPAVRLLDLDWRVDGLWRDDGKWPAHRLARLERRPTRLLMFRQEDKTVRAPLIDRPEFDLLSRLLAGQAVGEALRATRGLSPETVLRLFGEWSSMGILRGAARS